MNAGAAGAGLTVMVFEPVDTVPLAFVAEITK